MDDLRAILSFWYRMMVASVPLLEFAAKRSKGDLRKYYKTHIEEEAGHDEMLKDDLRRLGVSDIPHSYLAAQIAGSQYYLVAHEHPALLLGYMNCLEGNSLTLDEVDALSPGVELTALRHHALHDPHHASAIAGMIVGLDDDLMNRVAWNESNVKRALLGGR